MSKTFFQDHLGFLTTNLSYYTMIHIIALDIVWSCHILSAYNFYLMLIDSLLGEGCKTLSVGH